MSGNALILAGHGSHISPHTAGIVWDYVDTLRSWGVADEITACFWKEPPAFSHALDAVEARQVFVVPVFTARGYFTRQVLPAEMGLTGAVTERDGKTVTLTPTLGQHTAMARVVHDLVCGALRDHALDPADTAVAIIGHGTKRDPTSRDATIQQAERLRQRSLVREIVDVYLDDEPAIPSIYSRAKASNIIALPWFLAPGSHVRRDVPKALGMQGSASPQIVRGRRVIYTDPIGLDSGMSRAILELARESGLPRQELKRDDPWCGFPLAGRRVLLDALEREDTLVFGPVRVNRSCVWHSGSTDDGIALKTPAALRAHLRRSPFRPLPTRDDLPAGWRVDLAQPAQAHAVLETIYPGLVVDWAASLAGHFRAEPLAETSARQLGFFKDIHLLGKTLIEKTVKQVCGACIRQPTWHTGSTDPLPCKAACNMWLSTAKKLGESV